MPFYHLERFLWWYFMKNNQNQKGIINNLPEQIKRISGYGTKEIVRLIILIIIPISFPLTWRFLCNFIARNFSGNGYGGLFIFFFALLPIYSLIYGLCALKSKHRKKFGWYNPISAFLCFFSTTQCTVLDLFGNHLTLKYANILFSWIALWTFIPIWIYNLKLKHRDNYDSDKEQFKEDNEFSQSDITNINAEQENKNLSKTLGKAKRIIGKTLLLIFPIFFPHAWKLLARILLLITNADDGNFESKVIFITILTFFSTYCFVYGLCTLKSNNKKFLAWYNSIATILSILWFSSAIKWPYSVGTHFFRDYTFPLFYFFAFCTFLPIWIHNAKKSKKPKKKLQARVSSKLI